MIISAVIAHFVAVVSPGPDTAIILREVSKNGFASGFLCSIGIGLGVTIHSILAVYGISLILFSISTLSIIISMIGGSYLLYLGYLLYIVFVILVLKRVPVDINRFKF